MSELLPFLKIFLVSFLSPRQRLPEFRGSFIGWLRIGLVNPGK